MQRAPSPLYIHLAAGLRSAIKLERILLQRSALLIFVCGGPTAAMPPSARQRFLQFAKVHIQDLRFFIAEDVFEALRATHSPDLLELEEHLATLCHCILIFVESPGAIAELGAFALDRDLAALVLPVVGVEHRHDKSFIIDGPIRKLNQVSNFRPAVFADFPSILTSAPTIRDRLSKGIPRRPDGLDLRNYQTNSRFRHRDRLFLLADIISLFAPIRFDELLEVLAVLYGAQSFQPHIELHLLRTLGLIKQISQTPSSSGITQHYYVRADRDPRTFLLYRSLNPAKLRARVICAYRKKNDGRLKLLADEILSSLT